MKELSITDKASLTSKLKPWQPIASISPEHHQSKKASGWPDSELMWPHGARCSLLASPPSVPLSPVSTPQQNTRLPAPRRIRGLIYCASHGRRERGLTREVTLMSFSRGRAKGESIEMPMAEFENLKIVPLFSQLPAS